MAEFLLANSSQVFLGLVVVVFFLCCTALLRSNHPELNLPADAKRLVIRNRWGRPLIGLRLERATEEQKEQSQFFGCAEGVAHNWDTSRRSSTIASIFQNDDDNTAYPSTSWPASRPDIKISARSRHARP